MLSGIPLLTATELARNEGISAHFTRVRWPELGHPDITPVTPVEAGRPLWQIAERHDFTLFEYWLTDHAGHSQSTEFAREVFGRPIGQNQGVQFPLAEAHIEVEAADLMRWEACRRFDAHEPCGAQANMAKYLAAKASWEAADACLQFHGGFGFACEVDVERKCRETRLYQVAPVSTNLILAYVAEHVLWLPRSF